VKKLVKASKIMIDINRDNNARGILCDVSTQRILTIHILSDPSTSMVVDAIGINVQLKELSHIMKDTLIWEPKRAKRGHTTLTLLKQYLMGYF
jgi:hypothetical protein